MNNNGKQYVAGVDFGSSNLVMAVGTVEAEGEINVEALLSRPSDGIEMGVIQNVNNVCEVLRDMKREIEEELGIRIEEAYAGVSGAYIRYHNYSDHVFTSNTETGILSQGDVDALNDRMNRVTVPEDEVVMDRFPLNYILDHNRYTDKPVGAFSRQLSSTFAFIIGKRQPLSRIEMVFRNSGMRLAGIFANSAIFADALLTADERNEGAAAIDIGADTTDVAVYSGGILRYAATIPMGGRAIDSDINKHGVALRNIEALKKQCGTALSESVSEKAYVKIPTSSKSFKKVMKRNLAAIIEARLMDIIEYVKTEIKDSGYDGKLPYGLVLTGGTASITDIDKLFADHTGRDVRIAMASEGLNKESCTKVDSLEYSAVIALLSAGVANGGCEVAETGSRHTAPKQESVRPSQTEQPEPPKERKPFEPKRSTATTYQPPQRPEYKVPEPPVRTEFKPSVPPQTPVQTTVVNKPEEQPKQEKEVEMPKHEEPKTGEKPKKKGFLGYLIDIFQDSDEEDSFADTSLDASAGRAVERPKVSEPAAARPEPLHTEEEAEDEQPQHIEVEPQPEEKPAPKSGLRSRLKKLDIDEFFVEGEDKEEI